MNLQKKDRLSGARPPSQTRGPGEGRGRLYGAALLCLLLAVAGWVFWPRSSQPLEVPDQLSTAWVKDLSLLELTAKSSTGIGAEVREVPPPAAREERSDAWLAALARARRVEDPDARAEALGRLMADISGEAAGELFISLKPGERADEAARRLFDRWATVEPDRAAAWAQGQAGSGPGRFLLELAAIRWAESNLTDAIDWALGLSPAEGRNETLAAIGGEAVRSDPVKALILATELTAGPAQSDLILRASGEWAVTDPNGAMEWAGSIGDPALRQRVMGQIVVASAARDPLWAGLNALEKMEEGPEQDRAFTSIMMRWVQTDPAGAYEMVSQLADDEFRRNMITVLRFPRHLEDGSENPF
jgi:hypothetical protein